MKNINRREFLKKTGEGAALAGAVAVAGACAPKKTAETVAAAVNSDGKDVLETGKMELRTNPGNGDKVSLLGYGCMRFTMKKDANGKDVVDQENVNTLIDYALAHGVNYFDTAPVYLQGQSEKAVGIALSRHPRNSYYIATKMSNFQSNDRKVAMQLYNDAFKNLQTDYLDYYLLHSLGRGGAAGFKARFEDNGDMMVLHDKYHWDFVQIQMNYYDWKHADGRRNVNAEYLYNELDKRGIPIVIMEPLQGGRLAKPAESVVNRLKERDPQASIASWAFRFVGSYPRVLSVLSGMVYMEHLQDNLRTYMDFKPLTEEELTFLDTDISDIMANYPTVECNDCKYCMPCPYGIDIPGIFMHYNNSVNQGLQPRSKEQEDYQKLRKSYLVSYDRAIPTLRQADHCVGCKQCIPKCPQSIPIPRELRRIDAYVEKLKQNTL